MTVGPQPHRKGPRAAPGPGRLGRDLDVTRTRRGPPGPGPAAAEPFSPGARPGPSLNVTVAAAHDSEGGQAGAEWATHDLARWPRPSRRRRGDPPGPPPPPSRGLTRRSSRGSPARPDSL